jgi:hypothetical protein
MNRFDTLSPSRRWLIRQILYAVGLMVITTFALTFSFAGRYNPSVGDVAARDVRSPREISFVSEIRSEQALEEAVRQVEPVYTRPDPSIARQQLDRTQEIIDFLSAVRADEYATEAQKRIWVLIVEDLGDLPVSEVDTLLNLPETNWTRVQLETLRLVDQTMRREEIRSGNLELLRSRVPALVPLDLPQDEADVVSALTQRLLTPNTFYDEMATEVAREGAVENTTPVFRTIRNGEVIVREGNVITPLDLEALEQLGLTGRRRDWRDIGPIILLSIVGSFLLGFYLYQVKPEVLRRPSHEGMLLLLMAVFIFLVWLLIPSGPLLLYLFPSAALGMLLTSTSGYATAVGGVIYLALVGGWIGGSSLFVAAMLALNGLAAAITLPRYEQTRSIFQSGLLGGLASAVVGLAFTAAEVRTDPLPYLINMGVSIAGGVISGGLTLGGLFLLAPLFDLATTFRLVELSHPNHPLLKRLLREAPATFHHTMMVASMAEQAAERIGANALLTRAGAYYHDIGKLTRPYFFSENQEGLSNPHDRLDPHTSVDLVVSHVQDGIKLARQYRLPSRIRSFIPEHQGTMQVSFFYHKALEAAGGEAGLVDESQFRYPGPRPQSRESALVMLADGCEAATRAARTTSGGQVGEVVGAIFAARLEDGQLSASPLTLRELEIVKETYVEVLRGAFHPRVQYPGSSQKKPDTGEEEA